MASEGLNNSAFKYSEPSLITFSLKFMYILENYTFKRYEYYGEVNVILSSAIYIHWEPTL